ncbi:MAG: EAL domain-containing protein [Gammaproteobacteria bacterium]|nr:EAL domain-containing protein [Gammaproteobacteria bacterium]
MPANKNKTGQNERISTDPVRRLKKLYDLSMTLAGDPTDVFRHVARMIGELFDVRVVCLSEIRGEELYFISVYIDGDVVTNAGHCPLDITPCATVEKTKDVRIYDRVIERFPAANFLQTHKAFSYCGFPALDSEGKVVAVTCLLDDKPHCFSEDDQDLLRVFGQRIGLEIERQKNIEQKRIAEQALRKNEARYKQLVECSSAIPWEMDLLEWRFTYVGPQAVEILGYPVDDWYKKNFWIQHLHPDDRNWALRFCQESAAQSSDHNFEYRMLAANGDVVWIRDDVKVISDSSGPIALNGYMFDVTDRKKAESKIQHLAYYDSLTQLPNRTLFIDRLQQALTRAASHNYCGAVLFLDVDRFKYINDSLGHSVGDELLQEIANRLKDCVRPEDTVARLGGDEFVVLLPDINTDRDKTANTARLSADIILVELGAPYIAGGHELHITVSIGIALYDREQHNLDDILKHADTAMYRAKKSGRESIQFFLPSMQTAAIERLVLEKDLRRAPGQNELQLYYQPLVDINDNSIIGAEALLRWHHPQQGMIAPGRFIPVAEETGQILSLGEWVIRSAAQQVQLWTQMGIELREWFISINVSPRQFRQNAFVDQVKQILDETGLLPTTLKFEITEGMVMSDIDDVITKMYALRDMGVSFAIDDFGTGHSSLAYLKRLPLDVLKIDRSFVRDILTDPNDATIVETIISMARHLKLAVIAEGVETEAELKFLREKGCGCYQGYYFSRPLPSELFVDYLT